MVLGMKPAFRNISLSDKKIFDKYATGAKDNLGCEYCFPLVFVENAKGATEICDLGDMAILRSMWHNERVYFPPLLKDVTKFPDAVQFIEQQARLEGVPFVMRQLSAPLNELFDANRFIVTEEHALSDYVYNTDDLIHLSGQKFHSKRNFISRFYKTYSEYSFREYEETTDRAAIVKLLKKWDSNTEHEKWKAEDSLIARALDNYRELGFKIAVLYVKAELVAFSINWIRSADVAYTFFEKADTDYIGTYQVINQRTAEMFFAGVRFVNRQSDMNVEGLRKAKLSYNPVMLVDKYSVQHRG